MPFRGGQGHDLEEFKEEHCNRRPRQRGPVWIQAGPEVFWLQYPGRKLAALDFHASPFKAVNETPSLTFLFSLLAVLKQVFRSSSLSICKRSLSSRP